MRSASEQEIGAAEIATAAARSFLRGQTPQALARELAWSAVRATGLDHARIEWLSPLVEAQLASRMEQLESLVDDAARCGRSDHLRHRPHDESGASISAAFHARDAADVLLSTIYLDTLDWAVGLLRERFLESPGKARWRRRKQSQTEAFVCDVPQALADRAKASTDAEGWLGTHAA